MLLLRRLGRQSRNDRGTALALTAEHAGLADGQEILELGCGWGSLWLCMAETYPQARIVSVSNSASQRAFIEERTTSPIRASVTPGMTCRELQYETGAAWRGGSEMSASWQ